MLRVQLNYLSTFTSTYQSVLFLEPSISLFSTGQSSRDHSLSINYDFASKPELPLVLWANGRSLYQSWLWGVLDFSIGEAELSSFTNNKLRKKPRLPKEPQCNRSRGRSGRYVIIGPSLNLGVLLYAKSCRTRFSD